MYLPSGSEVSLFDYFKYLGTEATYICVMAG
jgi:hypothetical protein